MENNDELRHYGVLGMKWGRRNTKAYKIAKDKYKKAKKTHFKSEIKQIGSLITNDTLKRSEYNAKAGERLINRQKDRNKAYANKVMTKAKLKSITNDKTNKLGYNKAEFKTYVQGLNKAGVPNSQDDRLSSGKGTELYKSINRKKGKQYAEAVLKKTSNKKLNAVVIGGAVTVGAAVVKRYIENDN